MCAQVPDENYLGRFELGLQFDEELLDGRHIGGLTGLPSCLIWHDQTGQKKQRLIPTQILELDHDTDM